MVELNSEEQNKVKRMKRAEDSLRDLWDNIKCTNIRIIGVPEKEEQKKGYEKVFDADVGAGWRCAGYCGCAER